MKECALLAVGDELLDGRVTDTNSDFISSRLQSLGWRIVLRAAVGDELRTLADTVSFALRVSDLLIVTGGLGPTRDDLTREAVASALGRELERDPEVEQRLRSFFDAMGREMSPSNARQADRVRGAEWLQARLGTAPGQWIEEGGRVIVLLPGVPREMRDMLDNDVIPRLKERYPGGEASTAVLLVAARPESEVGERVSEVLTGLEGLKVSYRALTGQVEVRLSAAEAGLVEEGRKRVRGALGDWVVAEGEESLEGNLGRELRERGMTLAVAESCTGGMVGERITRVPGSSDYFRGGVVAYSYKAKEELLGVDAGLLLERGAVNEEVAAAMARGVREKLGADLGLSVTGVAGPGQGVEREPVGTVALAVADGNGVSTFKYRLPGNREMVRMFAANIALALAYFRVRGVSTQNLR
ncbi:competence/damage-inducible protein A [Candidatus Solincola tengchongensis]|uniref:competence/damage-inducible protein A n=1 Tax=Candidatus Solincola tengchongensis TaxID=2900693 RepID=UPI0025794C2F|nr:competence/damage-inducible protein A [Candidatus Solincola tengchongensis]